MFEELVFGAWHVVTCSYFISVRTDKAIPSKKYIRARAKINVMSKDEAAAALAAKRWEKTTKAQRVELAKSLNQARWDNATPEKRAAHGKMLAEARAKARKMKAPSNKKEDARG